MLLIIFVTLATNENHFKIEFTGEIIEYIQLIFIGILMVKLRHFDDIFHVMFLLFLFAGVPVCICPLLYCVIFGNVSQFRNSGNCASSHICFVFFIIRKQNSYSFNMQHPTKMIKKKKQNKIQCKN